MYMLCQKEESAENTQILMNLFKCLLKNYEVCVKRNFVLRARKKTQSKHEIKIYLCERQ